MSARDVKPYTGPRLQADWDSFVAGTRFDPEVMERLRFLRDQMEPGEDRKNAKVTYNDVMRYLLTKAGWLNGMPNGLERIEPRIGKEKDPLDRVGPRCVATYGDHICHRHIDHAQPANAGTDPDYQWHYFVTNRNERNPQGDWYRFRE